MPLPQSATRVFRRFASGSLLLTLASCGIFRGPESTPAPSGKLLIPVAGIRAEQLRDTYRSARDGGARDHLAIDIHARRGTPVLAAADGTIRRMQNNPRGGLCIYQIDRDGRTRYYYAHLDGYAPGLREGRSVRRGEVIGFVGDTGNAQRGDTHLHFSVALLSNPQRYWEGANLNPFELLGGRPSRRASR